jgi:Rap1a immunity proteins
LKGGKRAKPEIQTASSALVASPERRPADFRRPLHDDEAGALNVLYEAPRDNLRHDLICIVDALAALKAKCEGERRGEVGRVGGGKLVGGVRHRPTIAEARERSKNMRGEILLSAILLASPVFADSPDISARRLLASWKDQDPSMRMLAEVIASAFSSGLSWRGLVGGKVVYCPPPGLKGGQVMSAFGRFLEDHPEMAEKTYGDALAASLSREFPCQVK